MYNNTKYKNIYEIRRTDMNQKHLLKLMDWSAEEIGQTLDLAADLKKKQKAGISFQPLKG